MIIRDNKFVFMRVCFTCVMTAIAMCLRYFLHACSLEKSIKMKIYASLLCRALSESTYLRTDVKNLKERRNEMTKFKQPPNNF